jgi:hypothetical protein
MDSLRDSMKAVFVLPGPAGMEVTNNFMAGTHKTI